MASQGVAANSRLAEMQMKFQKKQLLEREQKKLSLTVGDGSASDTSVASKSSGCGNGKVRQMFDERRRGVGIDRSHPLKPIAATTTTTKTSQLQQSTEKRLAGGASNVQRRTVVTNNSLKQPATTVRTLNNNRSTLNGNGNVFNGPFDGLDNLDNETFPKEFSSLSLDNTRLMGSHIVGDRFVNGDDDGDYNNNNDVLDATITIRKKIAAKTNGIKLNPVITKKSPNITAARTTAQQRAPSSGSGSSSRVSTISKPTTTLNTTKSPLQKSTASTTRNVKTPATRTGAAKPATFVMAVKPPPRISTPPPGMAACRFCQRNFNEERLGKHEEVCRKMTSTKRKIFDASKHRVKGTEAEIYVKKGKGSIASSAPKQSVTAASNKTQTPPDAKKGNWRKKHEEFIAAIREAKKVQAYLAKGGKLSDLPPPPPSENPDYVQCPHCSRRFNVSAAERHIPKCATMQHNKPKPAVAKKRY